MQEEVNGSNPVRRQSPGDGIGPLHGIVETFRNLLARFRRDDPYSVEPRPLVFSECPAAISWSAKSASAQILIWYLLKENLLDEAVVYHHWIHRYRQGELYKSKLFRRSLAKLRNNESKHGSLIRVMRFPENRLVSSYRHALLFGYADGPMSAALGRKIRSDEGFSIALFLEFLKQIDITTCDIHFRAQTNPIDALEFRHLTVINPDRDPLFARLNEVEEELGLSVTDFATVDTFNQVALFHHTRPSPDSPAGDLYNQAFRTEDIKEQFPGRQLRELAQVQRAVQAIYAQDYAYLADHGAI